MTVGFAIRSAGALWLIAGALLTGAPSRAEAPGEAGAEDAASGAEARAVHDPWERMNRGIFTFNEFADRYFIEPVAIGWDTIVPDLVQQGIENFFHNAATPRRIVNDLLQGKPRKAGSDLGRFAVNTSFGLLGFFDPAGAEGFPPAEEDFGQTLGVWGVPPGPYLVLPLLGASSPRDTVGLAVETFVLAPEYYYIPFTVTYPLTGTRVVNARSLVLETVRAERASAFDFYAAVRSAHVQFRANQVRDRAHEPEDQDADEDLYYLEDEE